MVDKRALIVAAIVVVVVLIGGVGYTQINQQRVAIQNTQITFSGIQLKSLGSTNAMLGMDLAMYNPSAIDINLDHTVYDLYADGYHVSNETILGSQTIASGQTVKISTEASVSYFGLLKSLLSGERNGTVRWEMKGTSYFEMPILGMIQVPFDVSIPSYYTTNPVKAINTNQTGANSTSKLISEKNQTISIPTRITHLSLQPSNLRVVQGASAELSGQLTDDSGNGVANQTVYLKSDTSLWPVPILGSTSTNSGGWFVLDWKANKTSWSTNIANVYAIFEGSTGYAPAQSDSIHLEILGASLVTKHSANIRSQNTTADIIATNSVYQIAPRAYTQVPFNLPCTATVTGSFSTYAEVESNIIVAIIDQNNFDKLERSLPYSANYTSGKVESGNFAVSLQPGVYHLILSNTYSILTTKTVTIQASYICNS